MVEYVYRDGSRLTPRMAWQIDRLSAECNRLFGCQIKVTSGIRLEKEQIAIFLARYVTAGNIRGRRVYDTRVWNGTRYYRISSAGTVAVPRTSNHEIQGSTAAVDIRDTGSDAGVTSRNSVRGRWIRSVAGMYELVAEGDGFNEGWHFKTLNIFGAVPGGGNTAPSAKPLPEEPEEEDEDMAHSVGQYIGGDASTPAVKRLSVIYYPDSGFYTLFSGVEQGYINDQAVAHKTGNFTRISLKHWEQTVKPQLDKLLAQGQPVSTITILQAQVGD